MRELAEGTKRQADAATQMMQDIQEERNKRIHVETYFKRKNSRNISQTCCCTSESNPLPRLAFWKPNGFNARMGLMISWKKLAIEYLKNSRNTSQTCSCANESSRSLRVVFWNLSGFDARMRLLITWMVFEGMSKHMLNIKTRLNLKRIEEIQIKRGVAHVSQTDRFALYLGI
ncbi:uncharacterized protein G2W53_007629 [Senna tora]|uniref:Uncharacterized protein n=1 Tax=Senna tora TaxID=362788 RepID=A0A835CHF4_9FABA|nr:uncharacterized protein G2W53_007629 [Senna tora]